MSAKDLFRNAKKLDPYLAYDSTEIEGLIEVATNIGKAWSGSWLGYHSKVYYDDFQVPPPRAAFSQEWGLMETFSEGSRGAWREYRFDDVVSAIYEKAGDPAFDDLVKLADKAAEMFDEVKNETLSVLHASHNEKADKFLEGLVDKIENTKILDETDFIQYFQPKGQVLSRDMIAIEKGRMTPPHFFVLAKANAMIFPFNACAELKKLIIKVASHIENLEANSVRDLRIGTNIFIGHGRSGDWRELKDFVKDRLNLPWDEFNRVPVAGVTNITRLSQMLDQSCFAFLVMTAEDEQADGNHHARMNVIHEVGLFQGRLGFERAIVLLEDGCAEFSNIQGLGQIRYPKGKISAIFEDIRAVLEREGIVE